MKKIGVIGAGTMGNGIAHVFAQNNFSVEFIDINEELLQKGLSTIEKNLERQLKKEIISKEVVELTLSNIIPKVGIGNLAHNVDLVIEAVIENKAVKTHIYKDLNNLLNPNCIISSNTSSISITELASYSLNPAKFIGMHFMNPVPVMRLVEIIRGYSTSDETFNTIKALSESIGKIPVEVKDYPGFVSNRILMPMINEAIFSLYENVASTEDIDKVMKLGMAHPMGPLELADFIGLDVCLAIMNVLYEGFNDSKYRPCPLLKNMVAARKLGRKSGEGFYKYTK
ncbi:MAG: 3-hydroxybutyryl-CoA dehydrogenase [Ignavibacteriales bacterium]|nr:3-hydroxybutyryl-CoA dehydrogenase [Ignavibacteriales bacterium]